MKKFNKDIGAETRVFAVLTAALALVFGAASGALAAGPDSRPCMSLIVTR